MDEKEKGFYTAVEKEILILVDTIEGIISRTKMEAINATMAESIRSQVFRDFETIRRHAAKRNKVNYQPIHTISDLKDVNDVEIDELYNRMEGVYLSLVKYEQSLK